jgi:hypothetical protein
MNDNSRDDLDRALGAGLSDLASDASDAETVLIALRPRLRRARTRHHLARASTVIAVLVVLSSAAAVAANRETTGHVDVAAPATSTSARGTRTHASTTTTSAPSEPTSLPRRGRDSSPATSPAFAPPTSDDRSAADAHSSSPSTTTSAAPASVHTYSAPGGTLTVRYRSGALTLVSYHAATGYTAEVHSAQADDVEVRFSNDAHEYRIRVRVDHGRLMPEISEN